MRGTNESEGSEFLQVPVDVKTAFAGADRDGKLIGLSNSTFGLILVWMDHMQLPSRKRGC